MNNINREIFVKSGGKGGKETKKRYGKAHYVRIGKNGAAKRWANKNNDI